MSSIQDFFDRRFPLVEKKPWLALGWKTTFIKANGKPSFDSSAYQTTAELIEGSAGVSARLMLATAIFAQPLCARLIFGNAAVRRRLSAGW